MNKLKLVHLCFLIFHIFLEIYGKLPHINYLLITFSVLMKHGVLIIFALSVS